jgi:hypothetical protein
MDHGRSSRAMALIGLRMMPTFPSPPLKFRTVGFPQYGFKASLSVAACPHGDEVKSTPDIRSSSRSLPTAFARGDVANASWALSPTRPTLPRAAVPATSRPLYPRGPWLRCEFCCLAPSSLTTTPSVSLASTRRFRGRAVNTSRLRCAGAPRRPARPSLLSLPGLSSRAVDSTPVGSPRLSRCSCAARYQASSLSHRVATHKYRLCQLCSADLGFRRCIVRVLLRPVCLPRPPDWLRAGGITCVPPALLRTLSLPLFAPAIAGERWESG